MHETLLRKPISKAIGSSVVASSGGFLLISIICSVSIFSSSFCLFLSYFFLCAVDLTTLNRLVFKACLILKCITTFVSHLLKVFHAYCIFYPSPPTCSKYCSSCLCPLEGLCIFFRSSLTLSPCGWCSCLYLSEIP